MNLILSDSIDSIYPQLVLGSVILLISFILLRQRNHLSLHEPPLVPYKYPIIGHTIEYYKDNEALIKKCREKYGEIFSLYVFGKTITFVGKELTPEVFKNYKTFNFGDAHQEVFPLNEFMHRPRNFFDDLGKVVQANLSGQLEHYIERVQRQLIKSVDNIIGDGKVLEPAMKSFLFIIAKPIAATLIGEELSDDIELVNSFAYATSDIAPFLSVPPFLSFIHPILHKKILIMIFRYLNNPFKVHRNVIKQKIALVIENRFSEMKRLGDSYTPPVDILQRYIEMFSKDYIADIDAITDYMIVTIFASVHTTSRTLTFCLQEFVNNPQFHKEILEEQERLYKTNEGSYYSINQIAEMEKLDSFIRETLRVVGHNVTLQHKTLTSSFTFSNGYQVPKGRFVYIRTGEIHFDEGLQGQSPNEFNAFRHLKGSSASRIERNYIVFGLGKHACPGRFFAINEIKIALHYLLLNYNIKNDNNEKFEPMAIGPYRNPSNRGLIFEKRQ